MKDRAMTENEAIKGLETSIDLAKMCTQNYERKREIQCYEMAINALKEIQKYRKIGTPEECLAAMEKQTAKKGIREEIKKGYNRGMHHYYCPVCYEKGDLRNKYNVGSYCSGCGQKLDWSDEE